MTDGSIRRAPGAGRARRRRGADRRHEPSRGRRRVGGAGDPRGDTGERLPTRGRAGRPHPAPLGALARRRRGRRGGALPAALRLCGHARLLDHQGALGAGGLTGRRPRRPRLAPGHAWRGTASDAARASSRIHARNARTSGRCRAAAVVMRQPRSGASARRSKSGTSVRLSSSRASSIGRPMAAPGPVTAAWTSTRA